MKTCKAEARSPGGVRVKKEPVEKAGNTAAAKVKRIHGVQREVTAQRAVAVKAEAVQPQAPLRRVRGKTTPAPAPRRGANHGKRYRRNVEREIETYQNVNAWLSIMSKPFKRLVQSLLPEGQGFRITPDAVECLQVAAEEIAVEFLSSYTSASSRHRRGTDLATELYHQWLRQSAREQQEQGA